jgi:glutamate synthase (NADPH/NADH) small chain
MGKITGFLEHDRVAEPSQPVDVRLRSWREFVAPLTPTQAQTQATRCMDCGVPFCHSACPVHNVIPDFNELVYRDDWRRAAELLHSTNNFPELTGRVCPAPCEAGCTLYLHADAVGIKSIERAIADRAWDEGWVTPQPPAAPSGRRVAVVGSGPAGLAAAQQLARAGHAVTVFDKARQPGGLLRYGIPDFKLDKMHVDRRVAQLVAEGVQLRMGVRVGVDLPADRLRADFDAVLLTLGAEQPRELPVPGRELAGVHVAMDFLRAQNEAVAGEPVSTPISARGRHVVVIGGGDTGSDCVGTANRQGAASVTQLELLPTPPEAEDRLLTWPRWPWKLRTSSSHEEGCARTFAVATRALLPAPDGTRVGALETVDVTWEGGRMVELPDAVRTWPADLVLLAMGFERPAPDLLDALGVAKDPRGNALSSEAGGYRTSVDRVYAAGDVRRGQSLVVWAIREGRQAAAAIDEAMRRGA